MNISLNKLSTSLLALTLTVSLTACVTTEQSPLVQSVARTNDKVITLAEKAMCSVTSIGAASRRYNTPELQQAYLVICTNMRKTLQGQ